MKGAVISLETSKPTNFVIYFMVLTSLRMYVALQ